MEFCCIAQYFSELYYTDESDVKESAFQYEILGDRFLKQRYIYSLDKIFYVHKSFSWYVNHVNICSAEDRTFKVQMVKVHKSGSTLNKEFSYLI